MDWMKEVEAALKAKRQVLFAKDSDFLSDLRLLLEEQDRRTVILWALELAGEAVHTLEERYPGEQRPGKALEAARLWASGKIKMPEAKAAILDCHAMAKELSSPEDIALCHGVGQACSTVHTAGHGMGFPIYELTALVRRFGLTQCREPVENRKQEYLERLIYWKEHMGDDHGQWAPFLTK